MSVPLIDRFEEFFEELHGHEPYDWQSRLAAMAAGGKWPDAIDLPTASGKTACLDSAVFALACQVDRPVVDRRSPRRIFFCVNRRVIVDETYRRARHIAKKIAEAKEPGILRDVAEALRTLAGPGTSSNVPPLDVLELRGGIYRDNRWARSATQPTIVCTTVDQLGSRLLFRGYGVSAGAAPIQAALIAYDSLILLDEAHISEPFRKTLKQVGKRIGEGSSVGVQPFCFVPMTATPPDGLGDVLRLGPEDRANEGLDRRLRASKPARLRQAPKIAKAAIDEVERLLQGEPRAVGVIVNRVATAREIHQQLHDKYPGMIELVIGSMRPVDRDDQAKKLQGRIGVDRPDTTMAPSITVATQCLEVGADYDFDDLIVECASLDALRQRFGRLNRKGRPIEARAVVLVRDKDVKPDDALDDDKPLDPIYGNALARTWNWLASKAYEIAPEAGSADDAKAPKRKAKGKADVTLAIDFGVDALAVTIEKDAA